MSEGVIYTLPGSKPVGRYERADDLLFNIYLPNHLVDCGRSVSTEPLYFKDELGFKSGYLVGQGLWMNINNSFLTFGEIKQWVE